MRFNLSDPLQLNRLHTTVSFSPGGDVSSSERIHLTAEYERYDWRGRFELNRADFYDFFGPTKTSRKGYTALVGHKSVLVFDEPRRLDLDLEGSFSGNLDRLPDYQNVPVDVNRLVSFEAHLDYSFVRNSLGHVDDETGRRWSLVAQSDYVDGTLVPRFYGTYDRGLSVPAGHSSVWVRSSAGFSPRDRDQPFANFFFGAFGNNWVDHRDEKRYRHVYSFPGLSLNEFGGRNFVKSMVEWNLPPWRFRRAGTPGFYATWLRPALFAGGLATNLESGDVRRSAVDLGAQVDVRISLISVLELTVSVGGAMAFEDGRKPQREAMFSLKILK
jgi:hypothetical protein